MWIQTAKKLGCCFLLNKQPPFVLCLRQLGERRSWAQAFWCLDMDRRGGCWVPPRGSAESAPTTAYQMLEEIFVSLICTPVGVSFLLVCEKVTVAGLLLLCQRQEAFSARDCFPCVTSFWGERVCLLLWGWSFGDSFKGDSGGRVSPSVQVFHLSLFFTKQITCACFISEHNKTVVYPRGEPFPLTGNVCESDVLFFFSRNYVLPF